MPWEHLQKLWKHSLNEVHYVLTGRGVSELSRAQVAVGPEIHGAVADSEHEGVWRQLASEVIQHLS